MSTPNFIAQLAPLDVAIPLIGGAALVACERFVNRTIMLIVATILSSLCIAIGAELTRYTLIHGSFQYWMGGWTPHHTLAIGISFNVDPAGAGLATMIALVVLAATVYTWVDYDLRGTMFHALLLVFLAAMCGYALTGDLFNMFVWFELMSVAAIALTAAKIEEAPSIEGAINLAVTNALGGFIVLLGIALLYGRTGALNMAQMGMTLHQHPLDGLVIVAFALLTTGYFVKGAVLPFHLWLDDAHAVAPTPVCMLFSGVMVQVALYGVARIYWTVFAPAFGAHAAQMRPLFLTAGLATALVGAVMAYNQKHLKRLLAFSTVSHSGMFVAAFALFNAAGVAAAALFIIVHGLVKGSLFVCAGNFLNRFQTLEEQLLGGKGERAKTNSALYLLGGLALAGLPVFGISAAKALYDPAFDERGMLAITAFVTFISALDASAVLRSGLHIRFGWGKAMTSGISPGMEVTEVEDAYLTATPWPMIASAVGLLALAIFIGSDTGVWTQVQRAASAFVHDPHPLASHGLTESLPENLAAPAGDILFALPGLFRERIPAAVRRVCGLLFGVPIAALRNMHSGIYTDYVAYIAVGVAVYGAWLVAGIR